MSSFEEARRVMVQEQLVARGIHDPRVLEAMGKVPRERFVPEHQRALAYDDGALPIDAGQTISQPYVVALMTESLTLQPGDRVLEVGTGSGYQTAVLAELTSQVYSVEVVDELASRARAVLDDLGYVGVHTRVADGHLGWPEAAPFEAIVVTAAPDHVPPALVEQLAVGGRMCLPVGARDAVQDLRLLEKRAEGEPLARSLTPVRFVPMTREGDLGPRRG